MKAPIIMATIADNRCTPEFVGRLYAEGMRAVRINSAHVTPERFLEMVSVIRSVDPKIVILMDTKGPEIRTCDTGGATITVDEGSEITISLCQESCRVGHIFINRPELGEYLAVGKDVMIDDGAIGLRITEQLSPTEFLSVCFRPGTIDAAKTVSVEGAEDIPLPAVSERDTLNIAAAVKAGIDIIAHSFVRSAADVEEVRKHLKNSDVQLFSKIECRAAVKNFPAIAFLSDGILYARGDLGSQIPPERIPALQTYVMDFCACNEMNTIVSTQILQSMIYNDTPTRAELTDIATATRQGATYLLLCGETAQGEYPAECISTMRRTIEETLHYHPQWTI